MSQARGSLVSVTALGMCSSLGGSVAASAAARAGLSRPKDLDFPVFDPNAGDIPATGHPVSALDGFQGRARLITLAWRALKDLGCEDGLGARYPELGFFLALPNLAERHIASAQDDQDDDGKPVDPRVAAAERSRAEQRERAAICNRILALAELAIAPPNRRIVVSGRVGFTLALRQALAEMETGSMQACIVGAVDTLVDQAALSWLTRTQRVKGPDTPQGLQPGEAAVFMIIERSAGDLRPTTQATIAGTATTEAEDYAKLDRLPHGSGILTAVSEFLATSHDYAAEALWWLSDQNGEGYRAAEWGDFLVRCSDRFPSFRGAPHWCPAVSFGDTGIAAQAMATCLAARAFARGYAPAPRAMVVAADDHGARGVISLRGT